LLSCRRGCAPGPGPPGGDNGRCIAEGGGGASPSEGAAARSRRLQMHADPVTGKVWLIVQGIADESRDETGLMEVTATTYCLVDIAADHCWAGHNFFRIEDYFDCRKEIPHFATREEAEAVVVQHRRAGGHLRVMVIEPRCPPVALPEHGGLLGCEAGKRARKRRASAG